MLVSRFEATQQIYARMPSAHIANGRGNVYNEEEVLDAVHTNPY
jgi:hypothetical protein